MNKLKPILFIVIGVILAYVVLIPTMPILTDTAAESAAILEAEHDMDNYPGSKEGLQFAPWLLYFLPAGIGIVSIVVVLRRRDE